MADHAITLATGQVGSNPDDQGMINEDVKVVGTGGTSGTYTTKYVKQPQRVRGPFSSSISGQVVTLTSAAFTGTEYATIVGYA
jgi:hypothetical protein